MRQTLPSISDQVLSSISSVQKIQHKACSGFIHGEVPTRVADPIYEGPRAS